MRFINKRGRNPLAEQLRSSVISTEDKGWLFGIRAWRNNPCNKLKGFGAQLQVLSSEVARIEFSTARAFIPSAGQ
jgi:hypothetical protein